jgi:hypothetical protein
MSLSEVIKYKSSAGSPHVADIPNGGLVASKDDERIYGKANDKLIALAKDREQKMTLALTITKSI